ncbi:MULTISPECIES: hypothetical protein [unclassified Streptomyces]|uniref:hypothetical protein n=1 Tax=unclassified Streptomyces TaxID=2593676 RepID=UPI0029B976A5|nr:hypothetical protein [Streptomyces sp. DK15]MDX2391320.1 hypothetical protein [Streptomyces sp. DK15]
MVDSTAHQAQQDEWADRILAWITSQEQMDRALREVLRRTPSQREETVAHMAEAVRAAAQGLTIPGCAAAAGIPEHMLRDWLDLDASFAEAIRSAQALAAAHGLGPGAAPTPAALRLVLDAIRKGATWPVAAGLAGISVRRFNRLRAEAPPVAALIAAAQRARSPRKNGSGPRRRPARSTGRRTGYRLVLLDDPLLSSGHPPRAGDAPAPNDGRRERGPTGPADGAATPD